MSVTQAAISGISAAMINTQTASTRPNVRILPSDFFEEKSMKYPNTSQNVAGRKLKKKHMIVPSLYGKNLFASMPDKSVPTNSFNLLIEYTPIDQALLGHESVVLVTPQKRSFLAASCLKHLPAVNDRYTTQNSHTAGVFFCTVKDCKGALMCMIREQEYHLEEGDSLLFLASQPHIYRNQSLKPAQILIVFQPMVGQVMAHQHYLGT